MNPLMKSSTTQNVIGGVAISATGVAAVIATARAQFPGLPLWPQEWDLFVGGLIVAFLGALASRWIALTREPEKRPGGEKSNSPLVPCIAFFLCASLALSGCATNGVNVHEKTAEGYEFSMNQKTMSTWGSRTEEGAGSVAYEGKSPDGSSFNLKAGAGVVGQQAGDPAALITAVVNAIAPLVGQSIQAQSQAPEHDDRAAELAEIRAMLEALVKAKK